MKYNGTPFEEESSECETQIFQKCKVLGPKRSIFGSIIDHFPITLFIYSSSLDKPMDATEGR